MDINEVVDFVCSTPQNTNPNVLRSVLQDMSGGGGSVEYTAGDNITISDENVISATDEKVKIETAGSSDHALHHILTQSSSTSLTVTESVKRHNSVYIVNAQDYYNPGQYINRLFSPEIQANHGNFLYLDNEGSAVRLRCGAMVKIGTDPDTGEDIYSDVVTESEVNETIQQQLSNFSPHSFQFLDYSESYGEESISVMGIQEQSGHLIDDLIESGFTAEQIFTQVVTQIASGGVPADYIYTHITYDEQTGEAEQEYYRAPLTASQYQSGDPEDPTTYQTELNSADFYNTVEQAWQYAHITASSDEITELVPITIELFNSSTKYQ